MRLRLKQSHGAVLVATGLALVLIVAAFLAIGPSISPTEPRATMTLLPEVYVVKAGGVTRPLAIWRPGEFGIYEAVPTDEGSTGGVNLTEVFERIEWKVSARFDIQPADWRPDVKVLAWLGVWINEPKIELDDVYISKSFRVGDGETVELGTISQTRSELSVVMSEPSHKFGATLRGITVQYTDPVGAFHKDSVPDFGFGVVTVDNDFKVTMSLVGDVQAISLLPYAHPVAVSVLRTEERLGLPFPTLPALLIIAGAALIGASVMPKRAWGR